jgi:copper resistance protein C
MNLRPASVESRRALLMLCVLVLCVLALAPNAARAHARLVRSDPSARSTIGTMPPVIRLWFSERIEPTFATVSIVDARGQATPLGPVTTNADDAKRIDVPAPSLAAGAYRVRYRVVSVDGHVIEAEFAFTLKGDDRRAGQPAAVARP